MNTTSGAVTNLTTFVAKVIAVINPMIQVAAACALLFFFYGIFQYISSASNTTAQKTGKETIVWGIVVLVVLGGIAGIVNILATTLFGTIGGGTNVVSNGSISDSGASVISESKGTSISEGSLWGTPDSAADENPVDLCPFGNCN